MHRQVRAAAVAMSIACGSAVGCSKGPAADRATAGVAVATRRMPDGKTWTTSNLDAPADGAYCYNGAESNCAHYGRLYNWAAALQACESLRGGWRLPTDAEWRQLAKQYGGVSADSDDGGKAAYAALLSGGSSGFSALLGGGREAGDGKYARLEAHGLYWTASGNDAGTAVFYNFGKGGPALHRQPAGAKTMALSVRCVVD